MIWLPSSKRHLRMSPTVICRRGCAQLGAQPNTIRCPSQIITTSARSTEDYRGQMDPLTGILFIIGLVALIVGAELLVRGASRLAVGFGISPLVVGLTVVAFGTSSPELAVSIGSALSGQADIALGQRNRQQHLQRAVHPGRVRVDRRAGRGAATRPPGCAADDRRIVLAAAAGTGWPHRSAGWPAPVRRYRGLHGFRRPPKPQGVQAG